MGVGPIADAAESLRTDFVGFASFTILIWDHIITFGDEVRKRIYPALQLPLPHGHYKNRYVTPLSFVVNLYAYLAPTWTLEVITLRA
ncbi:hypothetical protein ONZ45_g15901 [Pleurotus djamor]|nr:hypothetical protein ONZ45_g15901 [Pleurotus djamor]